MNRCMWCDEAILAGEPTKSDVAGQPFHFNCWVRLIVGSLAHIEHRCSCFVRGSREGDPEGLTLRQAANRAAEEWHRRTSKGDFQ